MPKPIDPIDLDIDSEGFDDDDSFDDFYFDPADSSDDDDDFESAYEE